MRLLNILLIGLLLCGLLGCASAQEYREQRWQTDQMEMDAEYEMNPRLYQ